MRVSTFHFSDDGQIPNNPRWPLVVYSGAINADIGDRAKAFELRFAQSGWGNGWRNGIFPFPHYHSTTHEVLGIAKGHARVQFGGSSGRILGVECGDALLIPAGTGHERLSSSDDLLVIGAYPPGFVPDVLRPGEGDLSAIRRRIATIPRPDTDPVCGVLGPATGLWPT
jgi:uncharacterized protein YjlB